MAGLLRVEEEIGCLAAQLVREPIEVLPPSGSKWLGFDT
jgi:hypothetical protein